MDINASGAIAAQTAQARQTAALGFIKSNANSQAQIANVLSQAAESAAAAGGSGGTGQPAPAAGAGRGSLLDISV